MEILAKEEDLRGEAWKLLNPAHGKAGPLFSDIAEILRHPFVL